MDAALLHAAGFVAAVVFLAGTVKRVEAVAGRSPVPATRSGYAWQPVLFSVGTGGSKR